MRIHVLPTKATSPRFWSNMPTICHRSRQALIYGRLGIDLDRSTLADWVDHAAWHGRLYMSAFS